MAEASDSPEVQTFMAAFQKLRNLVDDAPEVIVSEARDNGALRRLCHALFDAALQLKIKERSRRELYSAPTNPAFVKAWRDYERTYDMGAAFEAGIKANFENAEITFDKFHVIKLANEAVDQVRREEARNNFQIKGRRYIFLKNVDHLTQEEKEALSRLEAQNLDTIQAMQIRMNLQQLFTMDAKTARRFLDRYKVSFSI